MNHVQGSGADRAELRREQILSMFHEAQSTGSEHNFVTDEDLSRIARRLGVPLAEVEGVLSFYRHFAREPRGRFVIRVCDSLSCRIKGSLDVYGHLKERLGIGRNETTADGLYTIEIVNCLGSCDTAPNMMVNDTLYTNLDTERIDAVLDSLAESAYEEVRP
jgi:NADH:ubiquinone oxidoreductase subunit E